MLVFENPGTMGYKQKQLKFFKPEYRKIEAISDPDGAEIVY